jgi:hypothetical protein
VICSIVPVRSNNCNFRASNSSPALATITASTGRNAIGTRAAGDSDHTRAKRNLAPVRPDPSRKIDTNIANVDARLIDSPFVEKIWAALILIAFVFISYAPAMCNGFVWDDTVLILRDPLIRSWRLIPEGFNHFSSWTRLLPISIGRFNGQLHNRLQPLFSAGPYPDECRLAQRRPSRCYFAEEFSRFGIERRHPDSSPFKGAWSGRFIRCKRGSCLRVGLADPLAPHSDLLVHFSCFALHMLGSRRLLLFIASGAALL